MASNKKFNFKSLDAINQRYTKKSGGRLEDPPPRKKPFLVSDKVQAANDKVYADKIKESRERTLAKQKYADELFKLGSTPNTRSSVLKTSSYEEITPDDPRYSKYYNPSSIGGLEGEVMQDMPATSVFINENTVENPSDMYYTRFDERYTVPEEEIIREDPYKFPTTKEFSDPGIQPLPAPVNPKNPNLHKEWNPITNRYEVMSPSNARQLETLDYQGKDMPKDFEPDLKDSVSRQDASFLNTLTHKRTAPDKYPEIEGIDNAILSMNKNLSGLNKKDSNIENDEAFVPTFKNGGNMKNKKHKFKPLRLHPNAVTAGKSLSQYALGGNINMTNPSVYGGKHLDTERLRDDVINPTGHGAAETANTVTNKALDMFIPGVGTLNEMSQKLASNAGEKLGGVQGQAIAENITNPFKAVSNVASYGFDGLTGKAQDEKMSNTINQHLNWEDDSDSFQQNIPTSFQDGGDLGMAGMPQEMQDPSGRALDYNEYEGNSHEEGGIAVGPDAEVEGGEVRVEDYIFSDFLEDPESGKTFADLAKKVNKKYEGRGDNDPPSNRAKNKELEKIMAKNEEERIKQEQLEALQQQEEQAAVESMASDVSEDLVEGEIPQEGQQEIPPQEMSMEQGMSPEDEMMLPPGEDMIPEFRYGGNYRHGGKKKYIGGGPFDLAGLDPNFDLDGFSQNLAINNPKYRSNQGGVGKLGNSGSSDIPVDADVSKFGEFMGDSKNQGMLASLAPGISDIARSSRVEDVNYARLPELKHYDGSAARNQTIREAGRAQASANQSLRGAGASSGADLATKANIASSIGDSSMRSLSAITDKEQASYVDAANRKSMMDADIFNREVDANAQNRAMRETTRSMAEKDMSTAAQGNIRDRSMTNENNRFNEQQVQLINQLFPNYQFLPEDEKAKIRQFVVQYNAPAK